MATAVSARDALDGAVTAIAAAGSPSARLDAELLLAAALGVERERLYTDRDLAVGGAAVRTFQSFVRRRSILREPVAYIVGRRGFRHLELIVDPAVLIPRPETELLVEVAVEVAPAGGRVLDVCTGSGAVALALADERPDLVVVGSDISGPALAVARTNGARLHLDVDWREADLIAAVPVPFDLIVANPPYVETAVLAGLEPEVSRHEPRLALDGGADGLALIRRLIEEAADSGAPLLALEIGAGQAPAVSALLSAAGFGGLERRVDLAGIERVLVGAR
ncbi:MAG: peptide chain release factor N(5)-glutamine methyltransferase [Solirubrobacteraceae bacterium]